MVVIFTQEGILSEGNVRLNSSSVRRYENVVFATELYMMYTIHT